MLVGSQAVAQQDTTPPMMIAFAISPITFDTGPADVILHACVTARDDLSGMFPGAGIAVSRPSTGVGLDVRTIPLDPDGSGCVDLTARHFLPYGTYDIQINFHDNVGNQIIYRTGPVVGFQDTVDLCATGFTCTVVDRSEGGSGDADLDGVPDDADNCPTVYNPNQTDRDHDGIGDACDPFPDNPDNDQAQCDADLGQCHTGLATASADLATCRGNALLQDADADGVPDPLDKCANTPAGVEADDAGCSQAQFCARFDATTRDGARACKRADWKNDEPLMKRPTEADCTVDKGAPGPEDDRCVPAPG